MSASLPLDHWTIASADVAQSAAFYGFLLPRLGFRQKKPYIWYNDHGLFLQFRGIKAGSRPYDRYGAGLNHLGFTAPDRAFVEALHGEMAAAGHVARLQQFDDGTLALFLPDPDGLRIEISCYPPGTDPVD